MDRDERRDAKTQSQEPVRSIEEFDLRFLPARAELRKAEGRDPFEMGADLARLSISLLAPKRDA
jgi:hypothetical protein